MTYYLCTNCGNTTHFKGTTHRTEHISEQTTFEADNEGNLTATDWDNADIYDSEVTEEEVESCAECKKEVVNYYNLRKKGVLEFHTKAQMQTFINQHKKLRALISAKQL